MNDKSCNEESNIRDLPSVYVPSSVDLQSSDEVQIIGEEREVQIIGEEREVQIIGEERANLEELKKKMFRKCADVIPAEFVDDIKKLNNREAVETILIELENTKLAKERFEESEELLKKYKVDFSEIEEQMLLQEQAIEDIKRLLKLTDIRNAEMKKINEELVAVKKEVQEIRRLANENDALEKKIRKDKEKLAEATSLFTGEKKIELQDTLDEYSLIYALHDDQEDDMDFTEIDQCSDEARRVMNIDEANILAVPLKSSNTNEAGIFGISKETSNIDKASILAVPKDSSNIEETSILAFPMNSSNITEAGIFDIPNKESNINEASILDIPKDESNIKEAGILEI